MTEQEKIEELLKPRYEVIALWPNTEYKIGDTTEPCFHTGWKPDDFPAIFRRLEWWEKREESEMPEYVNWRGRHIHKVQEYSKSERGYLHAVFTNSGRLRSKPVRFLLPATRTQFYNYLNEVVR